MPPRHEPGQLPIEQLLHEPVSDDDVLTSDNDSIPDLDADNITDTDSLPEYEDADATEQSPETPAPVLAQGNAPPEHVGHDGPELLPTDPPAGTGPATLPYGLSATSAEYHAFVQATMQQLLDEGAIGPSRTERGPDP